MSSWRLTSALELPLVQLAELFAASFEGYVAPVPADPRALATRIRSEHVDLAASLVALADDAPVGLALIARRGTTARIAAMGAVTRARRRGLGRALLDEAFAHARARGDRSVMLEVLEPNAPARALYARAGFAVTRRLVGFRAPPLAAVEPPARPEVPGLEEQPLDEVVRAYTTGADQALPWQLAPATIAGATPPAQAFGLGAASAIVDVQPAAVVLRALAVPRHARGEGHATRLLRALRLRFPDRALRVLALVPAGLADGLAARAGATLDELAQLELARDLAPPPR